MFYGWETATIRDANGMTPRDYYDRLKKIWSAETCAPRMRQDWSPENPTLGQCSITAFLMQDIYGGKAYRHLTSVRILDGSGRLRKNPPSDPAGNTGHRLPEAKSASGTSDPLNIQGEPPSAYPTNKARSS